MLKKVIAGLIGVGFILSAAPAMAGEWKLNTRACPDLVEDRYDRGEDRRDTRVNTGRRDQREDRSDRRGNRRDKAVTICPVSAFYYQADRHDRKYASYKSGHKSGHKNGYANNRRGKARPPLKWDRRMKMSYRYDNGRKIYVRG